MPEITLDVLPTAALIVDAAGRVTHANRRAAMLFERCEAVLCGMTVVELLGRDLLGTSSHALTLAATSVLVLPGGRRVAAIVSTSPLSDVAEHSGSLIFVTAARRDEDAHAEVAPRVASWADVAERVAALDAETLAVVVGVTGVQSINESFSRSTGDAVITEIVRRLTVVSPVDTIVARIGGNRFVIVMRTPPDSRAMVAKIVDAVRQPIATSLGDAAVGCAVGVTTGPSRPPLVLLDRADHNLTAALGRGAGAVEWSDRSRPAAVAASARLGAPLVASLAKHAISADFQPVVDLATGEVVEFEAMARWHDDSGVEHHAAQFISVAHDTGVIGELGTQVLTSALDLCSELRRDDPGGAPRVSVNVSATELADLGFFERVNSMLTAASILPSMLQFEITETIAPLQVDNVQLNIKRLRETGVRFALDGFGSDAANLLSLRDLNIDLVKLAPTMSVDALHGPRSMSVLRSVLSLAARLGVEVVAKGIETVEQHDLLLRVGCRYGQGFLYSPPRPAWELEMRCELPAVEATVESSERLRHARATSIAASGALAAADLAVLLRGVTQRNGADIGAVAVAEAETQWTAWELRGRPDSDRPDLEHLVHAVRREGPLSVDDVAACQYLTLPTGRPGIRSFAAVPVTTSDGFTIGALCLLWFEPMRPGSRDLDDLCRCADHLAARIELAHAKSSL